MDKDFILINYYLKEKQPFSFSRFGDGEWNAVFDKKGHNCDKHPYYPDMNRALRQVLKTYKNQSNYFLGLQRYSRKKKWKEIQKFLGKNKIKWSNADCLHDASQGGDLIKFFKVLKTRTVVLVGPGYLEGFKPKDFFIQVPDKNCWLEKDRIVEDVKQVLEDSHEDMVVLFVASMPANVMVDELYKIHGDKHTFIDVGSVLDPYAGVVTRGYHNQIINRVYYGKRN